jgi:hypothetical protein
VSRGQDVGEPIPQGAGVELLDEGAGEHCQPLARTLTAQRMFDWLDDQIGSSTGQG